MDVPNLHPAYVLADETRAKILAYAEIHGVAAAALEHKVTGRIIYHWRKKIREEEQKIAK
jgi:hypothetical protein